MGDFFNLDNKFFQGLSKVVDCVILSVLWVFCCIPMATTFFLAWQSASVFGWILCWLTSFLAGPATTALYYAVNKVIRHGRSYLWKEYWHAFKSNFKQAALAALILTGVVLFLGLDCYIMYQFAAQGQKSGVLYVVFLVLIVLVVMLAVYLFAYMARFENSLGQSFKNAALIADIAVTRGLPDHAATVAIATAMQESRLTNLDYGDLDSLGLFQQRPSQGWGTAEQVSDMTYATNIFYDHLLQVPDWETIPVEDAAQEVQRSGYPELYAAWDAMARAWASGLTGERSAGVTCALEPATSSDADGLVAAIGGTLPNVNVSVVPPNGKTGTNNGAATNTASTTLTITLPDGLSADNRTRLCWQTAGWLVTHARQYGIDALHADGMDWNRKAGTWIGTETAEQTITFTLA